jgi:ribosomal protein S18 acetylase RimI-like enzyme
MTAAITRLTEADAAMAASLTTLIGDLSSSGKTMSLEALRALLAQPNAALFVARDGAAIVGMATLVTYRIPTGIKAILEDVVVQQSQRGHGTGEALVRAALEFARAAGAKGVDLTSRPSRAAANRLYQRLGFTQRETNVYRFDFAKA